MVTGRLLGGMSKINAHLYTRGVPGEYNVWAAAGRIGWSWEEVEPFFKKSEKSLLKNPLRIAAQKVRSPSCYMNRVANKFSGVWKTRMVDKFFSKTTPASVHSICIHVRTELLCVAFT